MKKVLLLAFLASCKPSTYTQVSYELDASHDHTSHESGEQVIDAGHEHDSTVVVDSEVHQHVEASVDASLPIGFEGNEGELVKPTDEDPVPSGTMGFFRTVCSYSHMSYDDPLVYPGRSGASHLHTFFGNVNTDANSTIDSLNSSRESTCRGGTLNASAYWTPTLLDSNGEPVAPLVNLVYYKQSYQDAVRDDTQPIPEGLSIIAGNPKSSGPQSHVYWACRSDGEHHSSIPTCGEGEEFQLTIFFPNCWDGENLDSTDHRSHMAYAKGGCPATHPVALPEITYNVIYVEKGDGNKGYRLSSDMYSTDLPGGMSAHADYIAMWKKEAMQSIVDNCLNKHVDCHAHLLGNGYMIYAHGEPSF